MRFFSGFKFRDEKAIFEDFLSQSQFSVAGFSYGAILAFEYALNSDERIDTLQLFSPAFFQNRDEKFIRTQLLHFKKSEKLYIQNFQSNSFFPKEVPPNFPVGDGDYSDLEKLLRFQWREEDLNSLLNKGTKIEIFLGERDKIIDSDEAWEFFKNFGTVCYIKGVGHTLN